MITVKASEPFKILYNLPEDTNIVVLIGGRGGMKTYEASKFVAFSSTVKKKRCAILRDEKETIRESILNEVLLRYDTANAGGALGAYYDRMETGIKDRKSGEMLVFTKGFRASDSQKKANLKSISNVDIAVVEEAEDIRSEEKFNTFADSIRNQGSIIIIILNTPDLNHWLIKRYFNTEPVTNEAGEIIDGYFDIVPKEIKGFVCIKTSYLDNPHLPDHIINNYRNYGNPDSHLYNIHYYLTAIKGYSSSGRTGQVFYKVKPIKLADYLQLPLKEVYGQDFGTSSPAATAGVKSDAINVYLRELNYLPMTDLQIGKRYCELGINDTDCIIGDSAQPLSISKLRRGWNETDCAEYDLTMYPMLRKGFNIYGAIKGPDSVDYGIKKLNQMNIFVVEESKNFWHETYNYVYGTDKNGNPTDPIDDFNHLWDAGRMAFTSKGVYY